MPTWLLRLVCKLDKHVAPDWWDHGHGRWVKCERCGTRFDATEQERVSDEMQVW